MRTRSERGRAFPPRPQASRSGATTDVTGRHRQRAHRRRAASDRSIHEVQPAAELARPARGVHARARTGPRTRRCRAPPPGLAAVGGGRRRAARRDHRGRRGTTSRPTTSFLVGVGFFLAGAISTIVTANSTTRHLLVRRHDRRRHRRWSARSRAYRVGAQGRCARACPGWPRASPPSASSLVRRARASARRRASSRPRRWTTGAGSCWTVDDDDMAAAVVVRRRRTSSRRSPRSATPTQCPDDLYLEADDDSGILCLQED